MKAMSSRAVCVLAVSALTVFVGSGCRRDSSPDRERAGLPVDRAIIDPNEQDKSGTTTLTGAGWLSNDDAVERIGAARCAREVSCSNIGPDKHFANGEQCLREVRSEMYAELNGSACPNGIDNKELDTCLDAIRGESCTNPIDMIGRSTRCRTGTLCLKTDGPRR